MTRTKYLKGECQHCSGHLEFPAEMAGLQSLCPHCGQQTDLLLALPPTETSVRRRSVVWAVAGIVVLCLGLIGALVALKRAERWAAQRKHLVQPGTSARPDPTAQAQEIKPADGSFEEDGFMVSAVTLEAVPGTSRTYAVGTLKNNTDRKRFGIKVELDLVDAKDQKLGTATDYQAVIEPGAEWRFKALVLDSQTTAARIVSIREAQ